ncbi:MAG TPA: bifunctional DNA-formamidopyrimidine glycosylase/DNA-(apurinic or apyrimidinic site) lyase [Porticoccaceae bacterium]|nr:bifunctional DNA-formamidopyrimidine glycosylase/DNA-(apurinic or apyrimidinic site) lyase [Porticoccaceae bacterium]HIG67717.1 bifunctional DNA-formamidopyrimidine glycosylase/DNA-(apurinic or apyrimidinic site) lyase [Porticoccaceae bacterium]HIK80020.1 bifunctional DNA-formamidopyrimidine glycosylase/DNA-(apurinic or apyrimidinic site) lyase [Porticoccaceae bacterium]
MPELPEVETTLKGIEPFIKEQKINQLIVRQGSLRWPVTEGIESIVEGQTVIAVSRRAKYLIMQLERGSMLVHLGMSGSLRVVSADTEWRKHDHIELQLVNGACLRYHDPRRFGSWLWSLGEHQQLAHLGPEPLSTDFDGALLWRKAKARKMSVKPFIMDNKIVVGVGNIYASEALFRSGIRPDRPAGKISKQRYESLGTHIKDVLAAAIEQGGTTLRDFVNSNGKSGYFQQTLAVYGRAGKGCITCTGVLKDIRLGQRSSVFCPQCQR